MKKYYIGIHDGLDHKKIKRDLKAHFHGMEVCNLQSEEEWEKLQRIAKEKAVTLGVHFPRLKSDFHMRDPWINHPRDVLNHEGLQAIEKTLLTLKDLEDSYLLVHFPKPLVLDQQLDWSLARLPDDGYIDSKTMTKTQFHQACHQAMSKLNALSEKHGIPIVLEVELMHHWLYEGDFLLNALARYRRLSLCADSARMHVMDHIDKRFRMIPFLRRHAAYISNVHLSNLHIGKGITDAHHPPLQALNTQEGWCDIEAFIKALNSRYPHRVLYEHQSSRITDQALEACYEWTANTFETYHDEETSELSV